MVWSFLLMMVLILSLGMIGFWVWTLIDLLRAEFEEEHNKIIWLLLVIFLPVIGVILYWLIAPEQKVGSSSTSSSSTLDDFV
jgi:heme/copper-type cytochrome/quinol oxidase subunit 2